MSLKHQYIAALALAMLGQSAIAADVLATSGSVQLTDTDLMTLTRDAHVDPANLSSENIERAVRNGMSRRILLNDAKKSGADKNGETQRAMQRASDNELIQRSLAAQSTPPANYPSDAEVQQAFEANKSKLVNPKKVMLAQIFLAGSDDATRKRADAIDADVKAHPDTFADAADKAMAGQPDARKGGELGWIPLTQIQPDILKGIEGVPKGGVSNVIAEAGGFHIVKVEDRADETPATLAQVKPDLIRALRQQKQRDNEQAYITKLMAANPVNVNAAAIAKLANKPAGK